jgi:hypothetical protein
MTGKICFITTFVRHQKGVITVIIPCAFSTEWQKKHERSDPSPHRPRCVASTVTCAAYYGNLAAGAAQIEPERAPRARPSPPDAFGA